MARKKPAGRQTPAPAQKRHKQYQASGDCGSALSLVSHCDSKGNPEQRHESAILHGCIAVADSKGRNSGTPKSASMPPPHHPTRNSACVALKKLTEGTDASIDFVLSPPMFKVAEAPGEGSQYFIMHWKINHAYLPMLLLLLLLLVMLLKEPLLKRVQLVKVRGQEEDERTLGANFEEVDASNLPMYIPDSDLKPTAQESVT